MKSEILKNSKNGHFAKGLFHGFCQKIDLFLIFFFDQKETERNSFLYSGRKKILFTPEKLSSSKVNKTDILQRG